MPVGRGGPACASSDHRVHQVAKNVQQPDHVPACAHHDHRLNLATGISSRIAIAMAHCISTTAGDTMLVIAL